MKKSIIIIFTAIVVISVTFSSNYQAKRAQINNLLLQNIECLSSPEEPFIICIGIGSIDCPTTLQKVLNYASYLNDRN